MTEKNNGLLDRLTSSLAAFRGEDDLSRYNLLGLEPPEEKASRSSAAQTQVHHYGMDGGYGTNFDRHFQAIFGRYQGSRVDYSKEVGDLTQSSLVMAAVNWLGVTLPEAPLQAAERLADGQTNVIQEHAAIDLLNRPNDFYPGELLWMSFAMSWIIDGNVYIWKVRNALGQVIQLWWLPHFLVEPRWPVGDDSVFVSHYAYLVNGVEWKILPEDMIHFRRGIDPTNTRKGLSPLASLLREIYSDNEAANCAAMLMKNCGIFPFVVSPKDSTIQMDPTKVKEEFVRRTTGDERGKPIVNGVGVQIDKIAFSPDEMDMKVLRRLPEERVAAVLNIPAIVLNFGAGLDRSTFANYAEAREAAYESNVIPTQRIIASHLNQQYLPEFEKRKNVLLRHDLTQVRVLQDDQNKLFQRMAIGFNAGFVKLSEARSAVNLKSGPEEDVYKQAQAKPDAPQPQPTQDAAPPQKE